MPANWGEHVRLDERFLRPTEVDALIGDAARTQAKLGRVPTLDGRDWRSRWSMRTSRRSRAQAARGSVVAAS